MPTLLDMGEAVITVEKISKRYRIGLREKREGTLVQQVLGVVKSPLANFRRLNSLGRFTNAEEEANVFWALRDINFCVNRGEVLGVIGHNGAGKSTLLKILSRITEPTSGEVVMKGRVSSLLEVGTGFHPELTGRENIFMNGTILGMTRKEIDLKFDEIVAFSGVENYIDTPVKFYSSGMKVRLGFAVAAHLEPEILIIDEVLAVGDLGFQRKCLGKMNDVAKSGRTVLFVSHNMAAIDSLCTKGLMLHHGRVGYHGDIKNTVRAYISEFSYNSPERESLEGAARGGNGKVTFRSVTICDTNFDAVEAVQTGSSFAIAFDYIKHAESDIADVDVGFSIHDPDDDTLCFILYSSYVGRTFDVREPVGSFRCVLRDIPLPEGRYLIKAQLMCKGEVLDFPTKGVGYLDVLDGDFFGTGTRVSRLTRQKPRFLIKGEWEQSV